MDAHEHGCPTVGPVKINQALHGYDHGHRLLAASIRLRRDAERTLLTLTDASDVEEDAAFPTLLAGYPLPDSDLYVLSRTWPAPEAGRPGSVWTHSLFLPLHELQPQQVPLLLHAFRKPVSDVGWESYENPLTFDAEEHHFPVVDKAWISTLLWALYESPIQPVIAVGEAIESSERQQLLARIVSHQWRRLTGGFAFAEAPQWTRELEGRPFDLQVTTRRGLATLKSQAEHVRVIRAASTAQPPTWAIQAASALGVSTTLSAFLGTVGDEAGSNRSAFGSLVQVWSLVASPHIELDGMSQLLRTVDSSFPRRGDMPDLKRKLFGSSAARSLLQHVPETLVLSALVRDTAARCLSVPDMELDIRVQTLWARSPQDALEALQSIRPRRATAIARSYITSISPLLAQSDLDELARDRPDIWALLVAADSSAVARTNLMILSRETVQSVIDAVVSLGPSDRHRAVRNLARQAPRPWAMLLCDALGETLMEQLSDLIRDDSDLDFWAPTLPPPVLAEWSKSSSPTGEQALILANYLDPATARLIPNEVWLRATDALVSRDSFSSPNTLATLFAIAVDEPSPPADLLAVTTFEQLWTALATADVDDRVRTELGNIIDGKPTHGLPSGLAARLAKSFRSFPTWDPIKIVRIRESDAFQALLEEDIRSGSRGRSLAYRVASALPIEEMDRDQFDRLQATLVKHAKKDDILKLFGSVIRRLTRY